MKKMSQKIVYRRETAESVINKLTIVKLINSNQYIK